MQIVDCIWKACRELARGHCFTGMRNAAGTGQYQLRTPRVRTVPPTQAFSKYAHFGSRVLAPLGGILGKKCTGRGGGLPRAVPWDGVRQGNEGVCHQRQSRLLPRTSSLVHLVVFCGVVWLEESLSVGRGRACLEGGTGLSVSAEGEAIVHTWCNYKYTTSTNRREGGDCRKKTPFTPTPQYTDW